ncbi:MAG: ZIP family metal transporter [Oscillospiraceae bacterium]
MNFNHISPFTLALLATLFTWLVTALGSSLVFFFKDINKKVLNLMLAFGAGVMIAASFWSLLNPAIELCKKLGYNSVIMPSLGFLLGGLMIVFADKIIDKKFDSFSKNKNKDISSFKRSFLMVFAVTLHNFPEGLAVGVAFGVAGMGLEASVSSAIVLAIGIGLQNFPEGAGVSLPLRREGFSRRKSFFYGQLSGAVEPIAGVIGVLAAIYVRSILPFLLAFSAGAMISVVTSELIPESTKENKNISTIGVILGFLVMMILDVVLQ